MKQHCVFDEDTNFNRCRNKSIGKFKENDNYYYVCKKHKNRYNLNLEGKELK